MKSKSYYEREKAEADILSSTGPVVTAGLRVASWIKAWGFPRHMSCAVLRFAQAYLDADFASKNSKDGSNVDHRGEA